MNICFNISIISLSYLKLKLTENNCVNYGEKNNNKITIKCVVVWVVIRNERKTLNSGYQDLGITDI